MHISPALIKQIPTVVLAILVVFSGVLMWNTSLNDSAIMDELAHIPAGYGYVRYLDYRLNPEHPPLLKALSALPLLSLSLQFPTDTTDWNTTVNGQWGTGATFLYGSGNNADTIVHVARIFPILLTLLTILLLYQWGRELLGRYWGLLPAALFALSPSVLAHGHYVTTDIAATFGLLVSSYFFLKWLLEPSHTHLWWAGIAFGVAQLLKFSLVLVIPYFILLVFLYLLAEYLRKHRLPFEERIALRVPRKIWLSIRDLIFIFAIGYALVFAVYAIFTWNYPHAKQIADTTAILQGFQPAVLARITEWFVGNSFLRPLGHYLLGVLMVMQRSAGGNTNYFLGNVSNLGWWYYFPVVFAVKETFSALILLIGSLGIGLGLFLKTLAARTKSLFTTFLSSLGTHFPEYAIGLFVMLYWAYSMHSTLNIGYRHILPTVPLLYLLIAAALRYWANSPCGNSSHICTQIKYGLIGIALCSSVATAIVAYPNYLSYFNPIGGGVTNGYRIVADSNYDWGQDLKRLKTELDTRNIRNIAIDYFGAGDPAYYLGNNQAIPWQSSKGNPKEMGIEWLAVSVNTLDNAFGAITSPILTRNDADTYLWLKNIRPTTNALGGIPEPDFRGGTSIFVYHL